MLLDSDKLARIAGGVDRLSARFDAICDATEKEKWENYKKRWETDPSMRAVGREASALRAKTSPNQQASPNPPVKHWGDDPDIEKKVGVN
jgi:hypothetical protein